MVPIKKNKTWPLSNYSNHTKLFHHKYLTLIKPLDFFLLENILIPNYNLYKLLTFILKKKIEEPLSACVNAYSKASLYIKRIQKISYCLLLFLI